VEIAEAVPDAVPGEVAGFEEPGAPALDAEPGEVPPTEVVGPEATPEETGGFWDAGLLGAAAAVLVGVFELEVGGVLLDVGFLGAVAGVPAGAVGLSACTCGDVGRWFTVVGSPSVVVVVPV
jgi:hypothetical protein